MVHPAIEQPGTAVPSSLTAEDYGRSTARGGVLMLLGRASVLPAGLISSVFLARMLGPADFGILTVSYSLILWVRLTISFVLNRPSVVLIAETPDWEPVAVALTQLQLLLGTAAGVLAFLAAPALAAGLGEPSVRPVLQVFALAIPISTLATAHRNVLDGRRVFHRSALFPVVSETSRLLLYLLFVGLGLGLSGAALAVLGTSCAELLYARYSLRLKLWQRVTFPRRHFLRVSLPLSLDTAARRLHTRLDLWVVQVLAGATAAGHYSVAVSANTAGSVFSVALSPVILSSVSEAWAQGHKDLARGIIRQSLRLTLCLVPVAALGAGAAPELIRLFFGEEYLPAAPLLAWVSFSLVAMIIVSITSAIFAAVGHPGTSFAFSGPLLVLALIGYLAFVPRFGAAGAAATTAVTAWGVAAVSMIAVYRICQTGPGLGTFVRVAATSTIAYALASSWHAQGIWLIPQLLFLCGVVLLLLIILGEVTARDLDFARSLLIRRKDSRDPYRSEQT